VSLPPQNKPRAPEEAGAVRTTIVGGRPPGNGAIPRHVPRGLEVLIKKAAVDPAFKKILFEKRAGAAEVIGLKLTAAEEAMLAAVPLSHLEGIIAHTRISPKLKPAFLGCAAGVMLAALAAKAPDAEARDIVYKTYGIIPDIPPETAATTETKTPIEYGWISGQVTNENGDAVPKTLVIIEKSRWYAITDENGYYQIRVVLVPEGVYTITASHGDYAPKTQTDVKVIPGIKTNLSFKLVSWANKYEYVPSTQPLIKGIMADIPKKEGD